MKEKRKGNTNKSKPQFAYAVSDGSDVMDYRLNKQVSNIMKEARAEAKDMGNNYIGSEHVLLAILKDTSTPLSKILSASGMYYFQLKEDLMVLFGLKDQDVDEIAITQVVEDMMERAQQLSTQKGTTAIDAASLSLALLQTTTCVAIEILHRYDLEEREILMQLESGELSELDKVNELRNLNTCGSNVEITGREEELHFMISILSRKDKANPLLIGEPGVGKTAMVEKLASLIQKQKVPSLHGSIIYELHLNTLVAGTKYRGDFEEKLQNIIKLLKKYPNVILFIDEIHQMIGAGKSEGSIDVSSVLKPYLARGEIRCIGATTIEEYEKYIEKDRALERRFQIIMIKEPKKEEAFRMMKAKRKEYEEFHHVEIPEQLLRSIVDYCDYYMPARKFPDKAIDVLDLACVDAKQSKQKVVNEQMIKAVVEKITNIPIASRNRLLEVKEQLSQRLVGQQVVISQLIKQLEWMEEGILSKRPLGVWLFAGNSGVGKHLLIEEFNRMYFNEQEITELDITNMERSLPHTIACIRRYPYGIFHIRNLHMANESKLQFIKQCMEKGTLEYDAQKAELRHSIVIMTGAFPTTSGMSLSFQQGKSSDSQLEAILGKSFLTMFDEVFLFHDLDTCQRIEVVKELLKKWNKSLDEHAIMEIVESTSSLKEVTKQIKKKIVKA